MRNYVLLIISVSGSNYHYEEDQFHEESQIKN
jgi:hypothetical protein